MNPAKKSLGQHWLFDDDALVAMVEAGEVTKGDCILEVGPGLGSLTAHLTEAADQVVAIEADEELASGLSTRVPAPNLEIVASDVLEFDTSHMPPGYKVVANIPYYITSKILRHFITCPNPPALMALLVQKEVAERVVAVPGDMSVLAFSVQYYAHAQITGMVAKELFEPIPKVDSAILQINMRQQPYFNADSQQLFRLVKAGFGERRKKLANALAGGLRKEKSVMSELLEEAGIDQGARAQELSMDEWHLLYVAALKKEVL